MGFVPRGRHLFVYDLVAISLAIVGAFALRFDASNLVSTVERYLPVALLPLVIQPATNVVFGLYRREWRYASVREMAGVASAVGTATVASAGLFLALSAAGFPGSIGMPRSFFPLEGLLSLTFIGGGRFAIRWALENAGRSGATDEESGQATLVYGAGEAGAAVIRLAGRDPAMHLRIVGLLDDDAKKRGSRLNGVRIFGGLDALAAAARATHARELVIAMPSASGQVIRQAIDAGRALQLRVRIVPHFHEILGHHDRLSQLRSVSLEDLLRREQVRVDIGELAGYLNGATVLVTGGGGSIGSELARQVLTLGPGHLVIADNNEAALWKIERELTERRGATEPSVTGILCDIRGRAAVEHMLRTVEPDVVFHAAALKHVPICELQPSEAVLTNIIGTRNMLEASGAADVSRFVMISTDKAVEPVSVMGATKRLAEMLTIEAGRRTERPHMAVRFGNVLGSSGSVVPIFERQLAQGLPITITHPNATRYFMTIPEAVSLILQAGAYETVGDVFILDMGEPVRIADLADDMIRLSGLDPADVEIIYTGLRPGERLEEHLFHPDESMDGTAHERVWRATASSMLLPNRPLASLVNDLAEAALAADDRRVRRLLIESSVLRTQPSHGGEAQRAAEVGTR
ncbi:MAG: polysaccharide biosynthesis protein [Chloroflexota bacterium]|nr:MAG: polysaccharide biosynthesis protein [Chloroflexota bacterium]